MTTILHLKSGISYIGDNTLVVMEEMARTSIRALQPHRRARRRNLCRQLHPRERPRSLRRRLPATADQLTANGFHPLLLDMSEFQKMDGGLSCLSLRF